MEPKDFGRIVWRRRKTVATAIIVVALVAFFGSVRKAPVFTADCDVLFQATAYDPTNPNRDFGEFIGTLQSNAEIIRGPIIAARAAEKLAIDAGLVGGKVNVQILQDTQIFRLTVVDTEPVRAGLICNAVGDSYGEYKREGAKKQYEKQLRLVQAALDALRKEYLRVARELRDVEVDSPEYLDLKVRAESLLQDVSERTQDRARLRNLIESGIDGGGQLIKPSAGGQKRGGNWKRDVMMGLVVGFMFGVGIALVREYLDDTVRDKDSTQRELGIPVLATLPDEAFDGGYFETDSPTVEAARTLRTTLASLGFPHEKSMLVITSALSKNRSTTLVSLAGAVAESGRTVLVIGSDLRTGRTHEAFGVANTVGLANVVRGQIPLEKAVRPAPGMDGVYVLPCGPVIGNPGELLSSEEMAFVLRRARRWAEVVLLDAPPVLAAADASVLGAYADGVLLVVSAGQTNRSQANEAKEQLVAAGARVLGAVLVGTDDPSQRANGNGGGYGLDLPALVPLGGYETYGEDPTYDWWGDEVVTASASLEPRAQRRRSTPPKKTAAASTKARPTRTVEATVRKPVNGRSRAAKRNGANRAAAKAAPKRATTATRARSTSASRARTPAKAPARGSTRRSR